MSPVCNRCKSAVSKLDTLLLGPTVNFNHSGRVFVIVFQWLLEGTGTPDPICVIIGASRALPSANKIRRFVVLSDMVVAEDLKTLVFFSIHQQDYVFLTCFLQTNCVNHVLQKSASIEEVYSSLQTTN